MITNGDRPALLDFYGVDTPPGLILTSPKNPAPPVTIRGLHIDGGGTAPFGVQLYNAGHYRFEDCLIENCETAFQVVSGPKLPEYPSQATFSEHNSWQHCYTEGGEVGFEFLTLPGGNGSFARNSMFDVRIRHASDKGLALRENGRLHGAWFFGVITFIRQGATGFYFDGNVDELHAVIAIENADNNGKGIDTGPNVIKADHQTTFASFTGVGGGFDRVVSGWPYREGNRRAGDQRFYGEWWDDVSGPVIEAPDQSKHRITVTNDGDLGTDEV